MAASGVHSTMALISLRNFLRVSFLFVASVHAVDAATSAPVVDLGYAKYQGVVESNITTFRGIRYAAPPTGNLRWQAPASPANVGGIQQAVDNPTQCLQGAEGTAATNPLTVRDVEQSEDCLFLSVYSPGFNSNASLPTIVWIHGGGYALGSAGEYNGAEIVQESKNQVVVVVIQYRLGLFGFLAGQEVKDGGALNAGLLDQDFALRWVHKNIHKFGGDSAKVAIWGQSAGAGSILHHVIARNGKTSPKLFRAAITSSTYLPSLYKYNGKVPQTHFNDVAAQAGCNGTKPLDCLRAVDAATLGGINVNTILNAFLGTFVFGPVIDGSFITQSPTNALLHGHVNGVTLLSVTNINEGVIFINQTAEHDVAEYVRNLFPLFGIEESNAAAAVYKSVGSSLDQVNAIMGESTFICPSYLLLDAFPGNSYKGQYAIPPSLHGDDTINYFPTFSEFNATLRFNNTAFITAFAQGFVAFAAHLDPNEKLRPSIAPRWPKWSRGSEVEMVFNETEGGGAPDIKRVGTEGALLERCEFWRNMSHLTGQ
ncbi:Alpha/Beta hydrolase protein [Mycena vitilis]|nr:Alpha/Beta hydrolase protein [Mycena vitilis]